MMNAIDRRVVQTNCTWIHTEEWERGGRLRLRRISGRWSGEGKKEGRAATILRILYTCDVHIIYLMSIEEAASAERGKRDYYCL